MKMSGRSLVLGFMLAAVFGCSKLETLPQPYTTVRSDKQRVAVRLEDASRSQEWAQGQTQFSLNLFREIEKASADGNLLISPHSLTSALAMLYAGSTGDVETAMAGALHFFQPQAEFHSTANAIDSDIATRTQTSAGFTLQIENAVWTDTHAKPLASFLDTLGENYGAGVNQTDFLGDPEGSRKAINEWVSDKTEGKILELFGGGAIKKSTVLALTNAVYLDAKWKNKFEARDTAPAPFYLKSGTQISVSTMSQSATFDYAEDETVQAVELAYANEDFGFLIMLPKEGKESAFAEALSVEQLGKITGSLQSIWTKVTLPKFEFSWNGVSTKEYLQALGMPVSGFSGILPPEYGPLDVESVSHKTWISVDEEGTKAAAATGITMGVTSAGPSPDVIKVNRPFYFLIRDRKTSAILFLGHLMNPTEK